MTFCPGYKIGAYTVVRMLGQGGMGDVYEVVHEQLGTHYALKAFACDYEEAEVLQRKFLEEGRLLSKLTHPRIVRVFDLAIEPKSQMPYFVMDLVLYEDEESHTVEDVEKSDITENLVYLWFKDVAEALDYIHSQGIVHRDIKPSNLLLNPDYHVTLTDFGVSRIFGEKIVQEVDASKTMASQTGRGTLVLGTEHYIAPEVARGEEATPAADAYALGMMCFRLLTGMWYEHGTDALSLLSKYKLRWMAVLPRLLSPHAEKRPKELYRLKEYLKGTAQSPANVQPKNKPKPRKKFDALRICITTFFVAALVVGASWFGYQGFLRYDADRKSEAERMNAELKRQIAEQKELSEKIEAEQKRLAAEAAARQKAEAEKLAEAKRKREAEEREKEARRITIGKQENAAEKKPSVKPSAAPVLKEKKDEFVLLDNDVEKPAKDYGPIPNKTYTWLKGGNAALPQEVKFQLSNGAAIDLVPLKAATFYMSNDWRDGRTHHKVTLTRPFWMSKYLLTADQCRDFAPNDYEDCRPIEKALAGTGYAVSKRMTRKQIDAFCRYLSEKYKSQLPKGYIFRLPTEAEWEYAFDPDATTRMYEDKGGWLNSAAYWSQTGIQTMIELRKTRNLDVVCQWSEDPNWGRSGGWTRNSEIFIGGRMQPFANGVFDLIMTWASVYLDVIEGKRNPNPWDYNDFVKYDDVATDPVSWIPSVDIYSATRSVRRQWEWQRFSCSMSETVLTHFVLGPDLIAERAWENSRRADQKKARKEPLRMMPVKWAPDATLRKLNGERKYCFVMDNGTKMDFCLCPSGKFNMSNADGVDRLTHRATLTHPFLISKYNVTADQWRDFGPHDCEGVPRELEKLFKKEKYPICVRRNYVQWCKFCEYLTERYKSILPKGYVFRLPTEAEVEWAMIADENGNVRNLGEKFDDCSEGYRNGLSRMLDKKRFADIGHFDLAGWYREHYVGGRTAANAWGVCDFRFDKICLDLLDADRHKSPEKADSGIGDAIFERERPYATMETDPLRWDGRCGGYFIRRWWGSDRRLWPKHSNCLAHIVIGPDLISELQKKEDADYPGEDFGGVFLGGKAKVVDVSTGRSRPFNSPQGWDRLLSRENVIVREKDYDEDWRGCHTDNELTPWVQIELDSCRTITGLQIESFRHWHLARHLRVWVSDGSKEMRLVAQEDRQLQRFRFDLRGKNIKAKYIRIGREPGFMKDWFSLNKVLIYGK